ncbi:MAG: hypothetical protein HZA31_04280 [Opitutae bacterium]|nr:hypothetical protein [Opitutae bacterium]
MRSCSIALLAVLTLGITACRKAEVTSYRVPKEAPPSAAHGAEGAATAKLPPSHPPIDGSASASAAGLPPAHPPIDGTMPAAGAAHAAAPTALSWTAPTHWQTKPASAMRRGSYAIRGESDATADLSIIAFPGAAGGLSDNLNRWRGQVGLPPLSAEQLKSETLNVKADSGLEFSVIDVVGETGGKRQRILGAIVPVGSESWFFKMTGPDALVAKEKDQFLAFLKTVKAP